MVTSLLSLFVIFNTTSEYKLLANFVFNCSSINDLILSVKLELFTIFTVDVGIKVIVIVIVAEYAENVLDLDGYEDGESVEMTVVSEDLGG